MTPYASFSIVGRNTYNFYNNSYRLIWPINLKIILIAPGQWYEYSNANESPLKNMAT